MERPRLRIGEVAHRAGVHRETLRYYERRALLPAPPRQASGKWAQELGFTLERRCCPFLSLGLTWSADDGVWLSVTGGPGVKAFLARAFRSTADTPR